MIIELVGLAAVGAAGYAVYKHVTVAQVKAELVKIEADAVAAEPVIKAKVVAIVAAIRAKL
jgi:hypothetical protein